MKKKNSSLCSSDDCIYPRQLKRSKGSLNKILKTVYSDHMVTKQRNEGENYSRKQKEAIFRGQIISEMLFFFHIIWNLCVTWAFKSVVCSLPNCLKRYPLIWTHQVTIACMVRFVNYCSCNNYVSDRVASLERRTNVPFNNITYRQRSIGAWIKSVTRIWSDFNIGTWNNVLYRWYCFTISIKSLRFERVKESQVNRFSVWASL